MSAPARHRASSTNADRSRNSGVPHGFLVPPKPYGRRLDQMSVRELRELHNRNAKALAEPSASSSATVQRICAEQATIESRLTELVGVEQIKDKLQQTQIHDGQRNGTPQSNTVRPIAAKQRALARALPQPNGGPAPFTIEEAMQIEQEAHARNLQRQQEIMERKRRQGLPIRGETETRQQMEARMWAFMNHKPTESDVEDDSDSDEDPSTWFEDDQDDGRKGQDIIEPDEEDYSKIIRIDESKIPSYSEWD